MLRIAICDDEKQQLHKTAALLERYLKARQELSAHVETFKSGREMLACAEDTGGFDVYILDILMPGLSGIDTGRKLRQQGDGGEIVYLTTSNDFAADSYEVRAFFYLQKFDSLEHFKQELVDYLDYYNNHRIKIKLKGLPPALHRQQALSAA